MKKIIALLLCFTLSFGAISSLTKPKEVNAVATTLVFTAGVSLMAVAPVMQMLYANGMLMPMGDMISYVTNMLYDKSGDNYVAKAGQTSLLEDLEYYTTALLTGNTVMDKTELTQRMKEFMDSNIPKPYNDSDVSLKTSIGQKYGISYTNTHNVSFSPVSRTWLNGAAVVPSAERDKMFFIQRNGVDVFVKIPRVQFEYGYSIMPGQTTIYENIKYIFPSGESIFLPVGITGNIMYQGNNILHTYIIDSQYWTNINNPIIITDYFTDLIPRGQSEHEKYAPDSYVTNPTLPFKMPSLNWYGALNGKAGTVDDLKGLINADEYLQLEILNLLQNQAVNEENTVVAPTIGNDGKLYYPSANPDIPDNPPYTPSETWYNNLFGWLVGAPDLILGGITDLWDNTLVPAINGIGEGITSIPAKLTDLVDTTQDIPMESINFNNLKLNGITTKFPFSIPFDYIRLVKVLDVEPIEPDLSINLDTHYLKMNHEIDINSINKYIKFFRWFVLLTFTFGLMMITRKVIKW